MATRSTRQTSRRKKPNPALYVGYVEDDETPEMIMKKFAEMERMVEAAKQVNPEQNANNKKSSKSDKAEMSDSDEDDNITKNNNNNAPLSEEQLISLFNDTSYYSINSLQRNNDIMFQKQTVDEDGFVVGIDDPDYNQLMFEVDYNVADTEMMNWMDADEDDYIGEDEFWDDEDPEDKEDGKTTTTTTTNRRSRSRASGSGGMRIKRERFARFAGHTIGSSSLRRIEGSDGLIEEKKIFCHEPNYLKVPAYPIPRSWLKPILSIDNRTGCDQFIGYHYEEKDILSMKRKNEFFFQNNKDKKYKAILMDPPFDLSESPVCINNGGNVKLSDFAKLPISEVIPDTVGAMLFIWVPSELTMQINEICESWGFLLVEHATWILRNLSYQIENRQSNLFGISKCNLLLYRRTKKNGKSFNKLELRHQRTSDSYFDFVRYHQETGRELKSDYHYKVIETLLPDLDKKENGSALFLWAPKNEKRDGWTCIADTKQLNILNKNKPNMDIGDW